VSTLRTTTQISAGAAMTCKCWSPVAADWGIGADGLPYVCRYHFDMSRWAFEKVRGGEGGPSPIIVPTLLPVSMAIWWCLISQHCTYIPGMTRPIQVLHPTTPSSQACELTDRHLRTHIVAGTAGRPKVGSHWHQVPARALRALPLEPSAPAVRSVSLSAVKQPTRRLASLLGQAASGQCLQVFWPGIHFCQRLCLQQRW
jgi:hypothetical protein